MIDNLSRFFLALWFMNYELHKAKPIMNYELVGRWPLRPVLQQPALQLPAISKYRVKIIFWVLEDGARRPPSYYDLPCRS